MAYDNTNSGALYRNDQKNQQNHPDHRGMATVQCPCCQAKTDFWLSAWIKTAGPQSKNPGSKFFSMAYTPKDQQAPAPTRGKQYDNSDDTQWDDDIPF